MIRKIQISLFCAFLSFSATTSSAQAQNLKAFESFVDKYSYAGLVDYKRIKSDPAELKAIINTVKTFDYTTLDKTAQHAYLINAYNALVVARIVDKYPIGSVNDLPDFFTSKHKVSDQQFSLNELEEMILSEMQDASVHLVLNCGAVACPQLTYIDGDNFDQSYADAIKNALTKSNIVKEPTDDKDTRLSKIFFWYQKDFKKYNQGLIPFINKYSDYELVEDNIKFLNYDWTLNDVNKITTIEQKRFFPVKIYRKGIYEVKLFNNYYTEALETRSSFFASFLTILIGSDKNFNLGFDFKYRSVGLLSNDTSPLFHALSFESSGFRMDQDKIYSRAGISMMGPRVKYQPFKNHPNINFVHSLYISTMKDAQGNTTYGFADFDGLNIYNQIFLEREIKSNQAIFFDIGMSVEGLSKKFVVDKEGFGQILFPVTAIYSYFPTKKSTLYAVAMGAPRMNLSRINKELNNNIDKFAQLGIGAKYFVQARIELEFLYTKFFTFNDASAHTFNLGIRYNNL